MTASKGMTCALRQRPSRPSNPTRHPQAWTACIEQTPFHTKRTGSFKKGAGQATGVAASAPRAPLYAYSWVHMRLKVRREGSTPPRNPGNTSAATVPSTSAQRIRPPPVRPSVVPHAACLKVTVVAHTWWQALVRGKPVRPTGADPARCTTARGRQIAAAQCRSTMTRSARAKKLGRYNPTMAAFAPAAVVHATTAAAATTGTPMMPRSTIHAAVARRTGSWSVARQHVPTGAGPSGAPDGAPPRPPAVAGQRPLRHLLPPKMVANAQGWHVVRLRLPRVPDALLGLIATNDTRRARTDRRRWIGASPGYGADAATSPNGQPARPHGSGLSLTARPPIPLIKTDERQGGRQWLRLRCRCQCARCGRGGGRNARARHSKRHAVTLIINVRVQAVLRGHG